MNDRIYKGLSLIGVAAATAFYTLMGGSGYIYRDHASIYYYMEERGGMLYLDPIGRVAGYLVLAMLALFILFGDRIHLLQSEYTQKGEVSK